jgi:hypothetical protein
MIDYSRYALSLCGGCMENFWPDSIFGLPMPWHDKQKDVPLQGGDVEKPTDPLDPPLQPPDTTQKVEPEPLKKGESIDEELALLRMEQYSRLKEKGQDLYKKSVGLHNKIKNIDTLLSLLTQYSQQKPDGSKNTSGSVDCTIPEISKIVTALRADDIKVPLPNGTLEKSALGGVVTSLNNQRNLLGDQLKEILQELTRCQAEQDNLYQALISIISGLNRTKLKIGDNIAKAAGH